LREKTSGALGLALAGITYEHPVTLVTDPGLEPIMHRLLTAYGASVDVVSTPHRSGGWQKPDAGGLPNCVSSSTAKHWRPRLRRSQRR
jgi:cysteine synthase